MDIGVIGCGRISQIMHLPHLDEIPGATIRAIADPADNVLASVGERYRVPNRYNSGRTLLDEVADDLDGVVVATPPHTHRELGVAALEADLDLLIEKPLALTTADANALVDAAEASDATAMVGYMKRHDPTYHLLRERVAETDDVNRIVSTLVLGQSASVVEDMYDLVPAELGEMFLEESETRSFEQASEAIGSEDAALATAYQSHLSASCHDLSALRGLFGGVERIEYVDLHSDHAVLDAYLVFEDERRCVFTSSSTERKEWEEFIRVETGEETLTLELTNPYVRSDPFTLRVKSGRDALEETTVRASYEESFKREMEHFLACIEGTAEVTTTVREARDDVAVFVDMFRAHSRER